MNQPLSESLHDALRDCVYDVFGQGRHLSSSIGRLFRSLKPDAHTAEQLLYTINQAVRYDDVESALEGSLNNVIDPQRAAIPLWLRQRIDEVYGAEADNVWRALLSDAPTFVRVNTLKATIDDCLLGLDAFAPVRISNELIRIDAPFGLFASEAFQKGWFEQQDVTSYIAACELPCVPGQRIVDTCAGAGGKTLVFAAHMKNRGTIIALDTQAHKLDALRDRAIRAGADIVDTRHITTTKVVKRLHETADGVFIDAPCTGTGVLRRNPDILHRLTAEGLAELVSIQRDILRRNAPIAKVGGIVVYATCSILPEEGSEQIKWFLATDIGAQFACENEWLSLPGQNDGDGFYVARLRRLA